MLYVSGMFFTHGNYIPNTSASDVSCTFHRSSNLAFLVFGCPLATGEDAVDAAAVSSGADDKDAARAVRLRRAMGKSRSLKEESNVKIYWKVPVIFRDVASQSEHPNVADRYCL